MKKASKKSTKKTRSRQSAAAAEPEDGNSAEGINEQLDGMFENSWGNAQSKEFTEVPPATYQTRIVAAVINNAKSSGRLQCSWEVVILDGDQRGRHLFKHDGLDDEEAIGYFKGTISTLGYEEPTTKEEFRETLGEIIDAPTYVVARVTARKKRDADGILQTRTSTRFVRALDSDDVTDDLEEDDLQSFLEGYEPENDLTVDEPEEEQFDIQYEKGDRVVKDFDGEEFAGKVIRVKGNKATVKFDDGEKGVYEFGELQPEGDADANADDPDAGQEPSCSLKNGVEVVTAQEKIIDKLARKLGFNPDDYDTWEVLLCELGDYCGLSGEFKTAKDLIQQAQKASA